MLEQILQECNNWFVRETHQGTFTIEKGRLALPFLKDGQYFLVAGSIFNDGLHKYPDESLTVETFKGCVAALAVPKAVIELSDKVSAWEEKNGSAAAGPFTSENYFGDYSYTRATGKDGGLLTWQEVFSKDLTKWRKLP